MSTSLNKFKSKLITQKPVTVPGIVSVAVFHLVMYISYKARN